MSNLINTQNYFPPLNTFHSFGGKKRRGGEKRQFSHDYFIKDTVAVQSDDPHCEGDEKQNKVEAKTDELWTILLIFNLSPLVL